LVRVGKDQIQREKGVQGKLGGGLSRVLRTNSKIKGRERSEVSKSEAYWFRGGKFDLHQKGEKMGVTGVKGGWKGR